MQKCYLQFDPQPFKLRLLHSQKLISMTTTCIIIMLLWWMKLFEDLQLISSLATAHFKCNES